MASPFFQLPGFLFDPTEIPIRRYVKVKSDANTFDPHWRGFFESRKRFR